MEVKEGFAKVIRKGETLIIIDVNDNMFHTMDMFLMHISKEKIDEMIKKTKEKK